MKTLIVLTINNGGGYIFIEREKGILYCHEYPRGVRLNEIPDPEGITMGEPLELHVCPGDSSIERITIRTKPVTHVQGAPFDRAFEVGLFSPLYSPNGSLERGVR